MGSGSRVRQYERRFFEGEQARGEKEEEAFHAVGVFGEYEVREVKGGGYELLKNGEIIGIFSEARIEGSRVVFKLSHGMNLEISEKGVREILTSEKTKLCGLIASDGTICKYYTKPEGKSMAHEISLRSVSYELAEAFDKLIKEIYGMTPHHYLSHHEVKGEKRQHYRVAIFSKKVAYDLWDLGIKGPEPYEFHVPFKYLDEEGKRACLRGFFSGDGQVSVYKGGSHYIRISSSYKEGLEELRKLLLELEFHPSEVHTYHREVFPKNTKVLSITLIFLRRTI